MLWILNCVVLWLRLLGLKEVICFLFEILVSVLIWFINWESFELLKNVFIWFDINLLLVMFLGVIFLGFLVDIFFLVVFFSFERLIFNWFCINLLIEIIFLLIIELVLLFWLMFFNKLK